MAQKKRSQKTVEYRDDWNAPAHKKVLEEGAKYGNDVALWPKDLAEKEYATRKRVSSSAKTRKSVKSRTKKAARKRVAAK
jgi:hypothetical protein